MAAILIHKTQLAWDAENKIDTEKANECTKFMREEGIPMTELITTPRVGKDKKETIYIYKGIPTPRQLCVIAESHGGKVDIYGGIYSWVTEKDKAIMTPLTPGLWIAKNMNADFLTGKLKPDEPAWSRNTNPLPPPKPKIVHASK